MSTAVFNPKSRALQDISYQRGRFFFLRQDWERALPDLRTLTAENQEDPFLWEMLAVCLHKTGQHVACERAYQKALELCQKKGLVAKAGSLRRYFEFQSYRPRGAEN